MLAGGTQTGKSTLADQLGFEFLQRYATRGGRRLILDTKPRYRAKWLPNGMSADHRYKRWDHGPSVPDSVVAHNVHEMKAGFQLGHRTVIGQADHAGQIPYLVSMCSAFLEDSRRGRPQLVQVDETCDFFHGNGMPIAGDALVRVARAGSERGTAGLYCTQRTRGISPHLLEHMERLYAFRMDNVADAKRFAEFGAPKFALPREPHVFYYWYKGDYDRVWGPYKLDVRKVA